MTAPVRSDLPPPRRGESWAYRARSIDALTEVVVERIGTQRPIRAMVRFIDPSFEGRQEWVPPARLKSPWTDVEAYEARERRWDALDAAGPGDADHELAACETTFDLLIPSELASLSRDADGATAVRDLDGLAEQLALEPTLLASSLSIVEGECAFVPWPITLRIARRAIERDPEPILRHVDKAEVEARREAVYGHAYRSGRETHYIPAETCAEWDAERDRPVRQILRAWCRAEAVDRWDELRELRREVIRLGGLVDGAIAALRRAGARHEADELERALGVPIEALRAGGGATDGR